jgi:hypothetical protein
MGMAGLTYRSYSVVLLHEPARPLEGAGYRDEGRLRGLFQPAEAGFVTIAEGFSPAGIE